MSWEETCHFIAQGVINIECGHTVIEKDSKVYRAMVAFCEYATRGDITYSPVHLVDKPAQ